MCYETLSTGMERIKILSGLRTKDVIFPVDFNKKENEKKEFLIRFIYCVSFHHHKNCELHLYYRWLLSHDISKRPTSQELLQSEYIPPPVLEECELRELLRHTLSNPQLKAYKYLVASCFKQSFSAAQDITYDKDPLTPMFFKPSMLYDVVRQSAIKVSTLAFHEPDRHVANGCVEL